MNVAQPLLHHSRIRPDTPAIVEGDRTYRYRDIAETAMRMAGQLKALGVGPGDRLGLRLGDTAQHIVAMHAAAALGAVHIPLDWRARPAESLRHLDELGIKLALVEPDSGIADTRCIPDDAAWRDEVAKAGPLDDLMHDGTAPLSVTQTSGTTGAPKLILWTHRQFYFSMVARSELVPPLAEPGRRYLCCQPMHYGTGRRKIFINLAAGNTIVLHPPQATAAEFVDVVRRHRIDTASFTPAQIRKFLELAPADAPLFPELAALMAGGSTMTPAENRDAIRRVTPNFFQSLGTAATGTIAVLRPEDVAEHAGSVGRTHAHGEIDIVDDADRSLPAGETGRLRFRAPGVGVGLDAGGLWEAASEGFRDGWYYTGDLASLDPRGYLHLQGRLSETISRGAAKIHPMEVEARLLEHHGVAEAAVLGRPVGPGEEDVVAFVVTRGPVGIGELIAHCRATLTPYKVPREIRLVAELPRNRSNKVDKGKLRELLL